MSLFSRVSSFAAWVALLGVLALTGFFLFKKTGEKKAYVVNQKLFEGFKGTKELENKLAALKKIHAASLDSMARTLKVHASPEGVQHYQEMSQRLAAKEQQVSDGYTAELWATINRYVSEYSKERGYDFVFGATGNGTLMYAGESLNITDDVLNYMNKKY